MHIKTKFPHPIREIENTWIPMSDGCRLAARIWLPQDAEANPVPAILEYIPYRKDDATAFGDVGRHPYFAGHGYASIRVDLRGAGDSDGILYDEYLPQEQDDALEVLRWIAGQPWCTGDVGIIGISWGGFNGLQIAARRPPELKAVISICSTDDRYADDVHYMGGCYLAVDMLSWASTMLAYNARPPDPRFVGERWREMWFERMEKSPPFVEAWTSHQRRDAFWKHGSVCEDYSDITAAVYMVGGWADAYTNAIPRTLAGLPGPRKGLIGPWSHNYPEQGVPGPAIGFLQECLRWWDYWLKGIDTGIMDEPVLRAWMQESRPPAPTIAQWPGRWVAEPEWPSPSIERVRLSLNPGELGATAQPEQQLDIRGAQHAGLDSGVWCPYGVPGDFPTDQREEDALALCFDGAPVEHAVEVLGFPEVTLTLSSDQPLALVAARLCDVAPDGVSTLVSRGLFNLTHRESHEFPEPLEPGKRYTVTFPLNVIGHSLQPGHRWRLSLSPTYWPFAWPSPRPVTLSVFTGEGSYLELPVRTPRPEDEALPPFEEPESAPPLEYEAIRPAAYRRSIHRGVINGIYELIHYSDRGRRRILATDTVYDAASTDMYTIVEDDPLSAVTRCDRSIEISRGDWQTRIETTSETRGDHENFYLRNELNAYEGDAHVFHKVWERAIPRDMV